MTSSGFVSDSRSEKLEEHAPSCPKSLGADSAAPSTCLPERLERLDAASNAQSPFQPSTLNPQPSTKYHVTVLTGGDDRPYVLGLAEAFTSGGVTLDVIGSDDLSLPELLNNRRINFLNLRGDQHPNTSLARKITRVLTYYARLVIYAAKARPQIFHILWNNKFEFFDRTLLILYYRLLGKKVVFTAHNVNASKRDGSDSLLNRFSLQIQYRLVNQPYKGLEYLVAAFAELLKSDRSYRLIIAGKPKWNEVYWNGIERLIEDLSVRDRIIPRIEHVPDEETELYFKAADVLVLPYTQVFQSGVIFLGYSFGLPAIVADVGSLKEEVIEGKTGFVFKPRDSSDLVAKIDNYFKSELFHNLETRRAEIKAYANERYSWTKVAMITAATYSRLLASDF